MIETPRPRRRARLAGYAAGALLVAFAVLGLSIARSALTSSGDEDATAATSTAQWQRPSVSASKLAGRLGVRVVHVASTGGGGLLDLRFQVLDPTLAAAVHDRSKPPALISEENGVVASDLLMGHQHKGPLKAGHVYYLIFENPGNLVTRGSRVSVLLGNASIPHIQVQ
jgi:hypothetical protein